MAVAALHRSSAELEAGLDLVRAAPRDAGPLELIVRRPSADAREIVERARLDPAAGLVGDRWEQGVSRRTRAGRNPLDTQLTVMNARAAALVAGDPSHWALAGDQLYVDLDLSTDNLPPGARLAIGDALIEVTAEPHLGCRKFAARFGAAATQFVNSATGRTLRLRGLNARVVRGGEVRRGDVVRTAGLGGAPVLRTERLVLEPVVPADTRDLLAHWSLPLVRRFLWDDRVPAPATVDAIVAASVQAAITSGWCLFRARRSDGTFVGVCGVHERTRGPELIYSLEPDQWHRGYAVEAARGVLDHCFGSLGLPAMTASVDEPNVASIRTLERLGFVRTSVETVEGSPMPQVFFRLDAA